MNSKRSNNRGSYQRKECVFIGVWVPEHIVAALDNVVKATDLDRSKIIRRAIEHVLAKEDCG
jgi:metal-responsive CopG/Arc/MetJ family transcriptional regulator